MSIGCELYHGQKTVWLGPVHFMWLRERRAGRTFELSLGLIKWFVIRTTWFGDFVVELYV